MDTLPSLTNLHERTRIVYMSSTRSKKKESEEKGGEVIPPPPPHIEPTGISIEYEKGKSKRKQGGGKDGFWTNPLIMKKIEMAYLRGARDIGAAAEGGIMYQTLKNHMKQEISVKIGGESGKVTLRELCDHWRVLFLRRVEDHITKTLDYNPLTSGTQDAWRILERMNSKEWGLRAGQGSVDGNPPLDVNSLVALRASAVLKKRNLTIK